MDSTKDKIAKPLFHFEYFSTKNKELKPNPTFAVKTRINYTSKNDVIAYAQARTPCC